MNQIIIQLLYNPSFENNNNATCISKFIHVSRVRTIMDKCMLLYKNTQIELNTRDTLNLMIMVEMCMQCMVGQIWYKLKNEMPLFTGTDEKRFLQSGQAFLKDAIEGIGNPDFDNLKNPPDWDSLFE